MELAQKLGVYAVYNTILSLSDVKWLRNAEMRLSPKFPHVPLWWMAFGLRRAKVLGSCPWN